MKADKARTREKIENSRLDIDSSITAISISHRPFRPNDCVRSSEFRQIVHRRDRLLSNHQCVRKTNQIHSTVTTLKNDEGNSSEPKMTFTEFMIVPRKELLFNDVDDVYQ